ncbi:MAG: hypothetical protein ACI3V4_02425 [Faecousia sp.]
MSQQNRGNGQTTETFRVVGLSSHTEALKKLARANPDWNFTPDEIVDNGKAGQKIYRLKFISKPVELRPDPDSVTVIVAGQEIGSIRPEESAHVRDILDNCDVQSLVCGIWGGQYKTVDEFYDVTTQQQGIAATVKIVYSSMSFPIDDDPAAFPLDDGAPEFNPKKTAKPSKKSKARRPIFKRWWFWAIVVLVVLIAIGSNGEPAAESSQNTVEEETIGAKETSGLSTETIAGTTDTTTSVSIQDVDPDTVVSFVEITLKDYYENYNVGYEDNILTVNVWQDGVAAGAMLAKNGNQECIDSWNYLTDSVKKLCLSISDLVSTFGLTDTCVVINVLNDADTDNVILCVIEGAVLYDAVNE